jgi:DHA1 family tetracycline resistance protein-like MFS transporter
MASLKFADYSSAPRWQRFSLLSLQSGVSVVVLFLVVFVAMTGFGIILPIFPFYAERVGASPMAITWTMAAFTLGQAVAAPLWGRLSDAYGRRIVLILTMFGQAVAYVLLAYSETLTLVVVSRVIGGMMAGNVSTAFAYVADITTEEQRPAALGKIGAAMGMGFIFGPALGGFLAGADVETANFVVPALASASMCLVAMLGALLFLPESLDARHRKPMFGARDVATGEVASLALLNRAGMLRLLLAALVFYVGMSIMESIFSLWGKDVFGLGPRKIGGVFFVLGLISVVMQGGLIGPLTSRFGEKSVAVAAAMLTSVGLVGMALATEFWQVWVALVPFGMGTGLFNPVLSSLVSKTAAESERGAVMGRYQSASAIGRIIGPVICGPLYMYVGTGAPYLTSAAIILPVAALLWGYRRHVEPATAVR